jgi:hypothetical protein
MTQLGHVARSAFDWLMRCAATAKDRHQYSHGEYWNRISQIPWRRCRAKKDRPGILICRFAEKRVLCDHLGIAHLGGERTTLTHPGHAGQHLDPPRRIGGDLRAMGR